MIVSDISNAVGCETLVKAEPICDILVNNLGFDDPKPFFEIDDEDWSRRIEINVMSSLRLSRAYLQGMMSGRGVVSCRVVFLSSEAGINVPVDSLHYGLTKTAVLSLSPVWRSWHVRLGVTLNAVLPGVTMVEWMEIMLGELATQPGRGIRRAADAAVADRYPTSIDQRVHSVEEGQSRRVRSLHPRCRDNWQCFAC